MNLFFHRSNILSGLKNIATNTSFSLNICGDKIIKKEKNKINKEKSGNISLA
jgi:hypothetical protein